MKILIQILMITSFCINTCYLQSCVDPIGGTGPRCAKTQIVHQNISAGDLSKVPYTGFDTLYFLSKTGDTCIVRGTGKEFGSEVTNSSGDPACPPETRYINQLYTINFTPIKGNLSFKLTQDRLSIDIDKSSYPVTFYSLAVVIDNYDVNPNYYLNSIQLHSVTYYRVSVFLSEIKHSFQEYDTSYQLLYNKSYGILRIKNTKQNEEYSLIPKP